MNDDILKQAENCLNVSAAKQGAEMLKDFIPTIVSINKSVYDEMIKQGFAKRQAFEFSCQYTFKTIFNGNEGK
ncbi:hypothetical protein [Rhodopseudomonas parapalustris]